MTHGRLIAATASVGLLAGSVFLSVPAASAAPDKAKDKDNRGQDKTVSLTAHLTSLNSSGTTGTASAVVRNQKIRDFSLHATGANPTGATAPHAVHIHYGETARNECPTLARDDETPDRFPTTANTATNRVGLLNTAEGVPAYGPVVVSLTTSGDTSPASVLAVTRFPIADAMGRLAYSRGNIEFTDVAGTGYPGGDGSGTGTAKQIADAVRDGEGVVVVHGVDLNRNGMYDAGTQQFGTVSELDPSLPQEATAPAACGVLAHTH